MRTIQDGVKQSRARRKAFVQRVVPSTSRRRSAKFSLSPSTTASLDSTNGIAFETALRPYRNGAARVDQDGGAESRSLVSSFRLPFLLYEKLDLTMFFATLKRQFSDCANQRTRSLNQSMVRTKPEHGSPQSALTPPTAQGLL